jgi:hypothetical protein
MGLKDLLTFLPVKFFGVDWLEGIAIMELGQFLGYSLLTTLFKLFHASLHRELDHDVVSNKDKRLVHVGVWVNEFDNLIVFCHCSSALVGLAVKRGDESLWSVVHT